MPTTVPNNSQMPYFAFRSQDAQLWPADSWSHHQGHTAHCNTLLLHGCSSAILSRVEGQSSPLQSLHIDTMLCTRAHTWVCSYVWILAQNCGSYASFTCIKHMRTINLSLFINLWPLASLPIISLSCATTSLPDLQSLWMFAARHSKLQEQANGHMRVDVFMQQEEEERERNQRHSYY